LRGLRPEQELRDAAADLAPLMLRRGRAEAGPSWHSLDRLAETDVEAQPFEDSSFDLVVTYTGRHCFPAPPGRSLR